MRRTIPFLAAVLLSLSAFAEAQNEAKSVEGVVTALSPHEGFVYLRTTDGNPIRGEFSGAEYPKDCHPGDYLSITGVIHWATDVRPRLRSAAVMSLKPGGGPPAPLEVDLADIGRHPACDEGARDLWGERVSVKGRVADINRRDRWTQLLCTDGKGHMLQVFFYLPYDSPLHEDFRIGADVEATGNALYTPTINPWSRQLEGVNNPLLYVERPGDVHFLTHAPWWTPQKFVVALVMLFLFGVAVTLWAILQRYRRMEEKKLADALGRERLRLAGELHDNFQQLLAGAMFRLGAAMQMADEDAPELEELDKLGALLTHAQNDLRSALWGMREEAEGPTALSALLKYAADRMPHWKGKVHFKKVGAERPLTRRYSGALLLLLQEAVGNALRHANPTRVDVTVTFGKRFIELSIKDDGCGFDVAARSNDASRGLGILSMKNRVEGVGGGFRVVSEPGRGTEVKVKVRL